jgi:hypothetical protein
MRRPLRSIPLRREVEPDDAMHPDLGHGLLGHVVTITEYGWKGATSVTFNGTPATNIHDAPTLR